MKDRSGFVRPLVICVFSNKGRILACCGKDVVKKNDFYRPLGGMIEFGERSEDALRREMMEELSAEIENVRFLGKLENIFTYNDKPHHEIVLVYDADFMNREFYNMDEIEVNEAEYAWSKSHWLNIEDCKKGKYLLYPEGLTDLL